MIDKYDIAYLKMAKVWSELSYCTRKKVGAIIVKNGMIISDGFNGTPSKSKPNVCEDINGETNWWVLHGEANAILKCAKHGQSCDGSTLYQTHSPCRECSKLVIQSGIKRVVYLQDYKDTTGIDFLKEAGVIVEKYDE
jgi:dCMP deaminase